MDNWGGWWFNGNVGCRWQKPSIKYPRSRSSPHSSPQGVPNGHKFQCHNHNGKLPLFPPVERLDDDLSIGPILLLFSQIKINQLNHVFISGDGRIKVWSSSSLGVWSGWNPTKCIIKKAFWVSTQKQVPTYELRTKRRETSRHTFDDYTYQHTFSLIVIFYDERGLHVWKAEDSLSIFSLLSVFAGGTTANVLLSNECRYICEPATWEHLLGCANLHAKSLSFRGVLFPSFLAHPKEHPICLEEKMWASATVLQIRK